jgi:hypothetical protein
MGEDNARFTVNMDDRRRQIVPCVGRLVERRAQKAGDSRDMRHAVVATVGEVFVTHDAEFARRLAPVPRLPYRIMSLPALVRLLDP